jgi:hypothetical protein
MLTQEWLICECLFLRRVDADTSFLFAKVKGYQKYQVPDGQPFRKPNAHSHYTVTPERTLVSVGEWPLHIAVINL